MERIHRFTLHLLFYFGEEMFYKMERKGIRSFWFPVCILDFTGRYDNNRACRRFVVAWKVV